MFYTHVPSPVGQLLLAGSPGCLEVISFPSGNTAREPLPAWQRCDEPFADAAQQLAEYFDGRRRTFELALQPDTTPFQAEVLQALQGIPYGETRSYGAIAAQIGRPKAARAVGAANGSNPLPIVIPCHRVVGSNGALTGFGGGLEVKDFLLNLERRHAAA